MQTVYVTKKLTYRLNLYYNIGGMIVPDMHNNPMLSSVLVEQDTKYQSVILLLSHNLTHFQQLYQYWYS